MGVRVVDACGGSWPQWLPACDCGGGGDGWLCGVVDVVCSLTASGPITTTITWLLCAVNDFGEKGAEHISSALRENTTITEIGLYGEGDM